jgi:hypothetical protein
LGGAPTPPTKEITLHQSGTLCAVMHACDVLDPAAQRLRPTFCFGVRCAKESLGKGEG